MGSLLDAIDAMPKAELHVHIEGSIEPEMMMAMAHRNGIELPWPDASAAREAYRFADLQSFLEVFYRGLSVLVSQQDFYDVTFGYLARAAADNIVHTELFVSPQAHQRRGIGFDTMMNGVIDAIEEARERFSMSVKLILVLQRHLTEENALTVLETASSSRWRDNIVGFGLGGAELPHPPAKFERVFARCRELGFRVVAHAGEEGPPEYVRDTLDLLKVDRIDHGVRAAEDIALVERLAHQGTPLTVCPVGNVRLGVFPSLAEHNLRELLDAGVVVTINTDDPSYFGAYLNEVLRACVSELELSQADLKILVQNGFKAAFLSESEKAAFLERLERYWETVQVDAH
jgi:adenosine deaminase